MDFIIVLILLRRVVDSALLLALAFHFLRVGATERPVDHRPYRSNLETLQNDNNIGKELQKVGKEVVIEMNDETSITKRT